MSGQLWQKDEDGGFLYHDELSDLIRIQSQPLQRFRAACDAIDGSQKGLHAGDLFTWDAVTNLQNAGRALAETEALPTTSFKIRQRSMTLTEYGNSVPFTGFLEAMAQASVRRLVEKGLKNDAAKVYDAEAHAAFDGAYLVAAPDSGTSTTVVNITDKTTFAGSGPVNNVALNKTHLKRITNYMIDNNMPPFDGNDYMCIGRITTFEQVQDDLEALYIYTGEGMARVFAGEIGRYKSMRFAVQTNIASAGWTNGKSDRAYFLAEDTCTEALVVPEEIRGRIGVDYGRDQGVGWYGIGAFGLVNPDDLDPRVIKWGSMGEG